jgi:pyruvate dehydrogenase E2 component (dihydrolipoamide acetyltransferase)
MQASFQTAPHIALSVEVDTGRLDEMLQRLKSASITEPTGQPAKITMTALLVKMTAWALRRHPFVNASLLDEEIVLWQEVNVGVAVAVEEGLVVPVIHSADTLSVVDISQRLGEMTSKARAGQLELADVRGGTFTISNLGMFGVRHFRAIINPPESAILAVGSIIRRPVVINDQDKIAVRPVMDLTLSADHRVIDGVVAARFLADLVRVIEAPELTL